MSKLSNKKWFRALFRRRIFIALLLIAQAVFLYFLIESGSRLSGAISVILTLISFFAVLYIIRKRDKGAYKLMWVILILTVPIFGGLFYLMTQTQTSHPNFKASGELGQKKAEHLLFAEDCGYKAQLRRCRSTHRRYATSAILRSSPSTPAAAQSIFRPARKCLRRFWRSLRRRSTIFSLNISSYKRAKCGTPFWKF